MDDSLKQMLFHFYMNTFHIHDLNSFIFLNMFVKKITLWDQ